MQSYHTRHPNSYSSLHLILSRSTSSYPTQYFQYQPQYPAYTSPNINVPYKPTFSRSYRNVSRSRSPVEIPQGSIRAEERIRGNLIKGTSQIEYVPVEKKVIDYVDQKRYELVPRKRRVTDYREFVRVDVVPREVTTTDYYAIEHVRQYVPQIVPEKYIDYVPVEHKNIKYEYIPVERQLVHLPDQIHQEEVSKYLGVREVEGAKRYENLREIDLAEWEREYGYRRGDSVDSLNRKIRARIERDKEIYYRQFENDYGRSTSSSSHTYC